MKTLAYSMLLALPLVFSGTSLMASNHGHKDSTAVTCEKCAKKDKHNNCECEKKGECACGESCDCKSCAADKKSDQ